MDVKALEAEIKAVFADELENAGVCAVMVRHVEDLDGFEIRFLCKHTIGLRVSERAWHAATDRKEFLRAEIDAVLELAPLMVVKRAVAKIKALEEEIRRLT
jgi:hypothetical protein